MLGAARTLSILPPGGPFNPGGFRRSRSGGGRSRYASPPGVRRPGCARPGSTHPEASAGDPVSRRAAPLPSAGLVMTTCSRRSAYESSRPSGPHPRPPLQRRQDRSPSGHPRLRSPRAPQSGAEQRQTCRPRHPSQAFTRPWALTSRRGPALVGLPRRRAAPDTASARLPRPSPRAVPRRPRKGSTYPLLEDLPDRQRVGDVGNHPEPPSTASADERVRLKHLGDEPCPGGRRAAPRRRLGLVWRAGLLLVRLLAADAIGVVAWKWVRCRPGSGMWSARRASHSSGSIASKFLPREGFMRER
jgi:hypothetical protein